MVRSLRGVLRRSGRTDTFILIFTVHEPDYAFVELPVGAVAGFRPVGGHELGQLVDIDLEWDGPLAVQPLGVDLTPVVGDQGRVGVPFVIATPHHIEAIRNPDDMGGVQPVDRWQGTFPKSVPDGRRRPGRRQPAEG